MPNPNNNPTLVPNPSRHLVCMCIYIYICAVKLLSGPSLGFLNVIIWSKWGFLNVIIWSKFVFLAYKNSGFKRFGLHTQLSFCVSFLVRICVASVWRIMDS